MVSTLHMDKTSSLGDVLKKSHEAMKTLQASLKLQRNKEFLRRQSLPRVPSRRGEPLIAKLTPDKNVAKRAGNDSHSKITNGGYCRTTYGGFFMH